MANQPFDHGHKFENTVHDTNNLHLSKQLFGLLGQADTNTCMVTLGFSTPIRTEESRQVVCANLYRNGENQAATNLKLLVN